MEETGRPSRWLALMRHAKAEGYDKADVDRELAARGSRDVEAAGRWFAERGLHPDGGLVSAAARTRSTWAGVARSAGWSVQPKLSEPLYAAGPESALDLIRGTADEVRTLVVIGHNPTMAYLAQILDDGEGDLTDEMATNFPTCAVAVLELDGDWIDLDAGACRLVGFYVPRD